MPYTSAKERRRIREERVGGKKISPVVDETWTRADVRRLAQLLVKRAKLIDNLKGVLTLEAIADLECACAFDELLRETR